ncbi:hypothetical protein ACFSO7_04545 [Bacillus sp. CGMCC 1.16607]|uniref:hypothetical protein n=1 Tax=Bacillus sp. CGMCC 1.16607 TaxID=3351842 RepID=UPI00364447A1
MNSKKTSKEKKKFDFLIDVDKENYLKLSIELAESSALIVTDNVLAGGSVLDQAITSRQYTEIIKNLIER